MVAVHVAGCGSEPLAEMPSPLVVAFVSVTHAAPKLVSLGEALQLRAAAIDATGTDVGFVFVTSGQSAEVRACGLTTTGALYCWGSNSSGALGDGTYRDRSTPVLVRSW